MTQPDDPPVTQGTLRTSGGRPLPLQRTDVHARLFGPVAAVELVQRFRNDTGEPIEAVYLFPLPHEASVHTLRFRIGERVVEAGVAEKQEARRAYDAAREEGRAATLVEQAEPDLFTLSVANVLPGEAIEVTLGYQEKLAYDDGEWRFVLPLVATDRYHEKPPALVAGTLSDPPVARGVRPPRPACHERADDVGVDVEIHARGMIGLPRSPSHRVVVEPIPAASGAYRVRLAPDGRGALPNRDFVLAYRTGRGGVQTAAHFERKAGAPGTFLLAITPPVTPPPDLVAAASHGGAIGEAAPLVCGNCGASLRDARAIRHVPGIGRAYRCEYCGTMLAASPERRGAKVGVPRDVVFLVDRSCSMRGHSVAQARRAVRLVLDELGEEDAVQLFAFDHERLPFDGRGERWVKRSAAVIKRIGAFLAGIAARGGTELEEALERAAQLPARPGRARIVVLLTDAALGNEGRLLRRAPEILGKGTRLYVLGVGPAVNRYLVQRLARACGGASDVLLPTEDVETVVPRFARRVRQAGPVLTNIALAWDDALPADVYPSPVPDLFGGQTVELLGRFSGAGKSRLVLTGETATGTPFRQEIDVELPEEASRIPGLERLWAKLRIDACMARLARSPGEAADVRREVLALALEHELLSPFSALVAEDGEKRVKGPAKKRVEMAAILPAGCEEEVEVIDGVEIRPEAPIALDRPVSEEEPSLGDFIEDESVLSPLAVAPHMNLAEQTRRVLRTLTPSERKVLLMRFGIDDEESRHVPERTDGDLEVTRERIRQIEAKALRKLRHPSRSKALRDFIDVGGDPPPPRPLRAVDAGERDERPAPEEPPAPPPPPPPSPPEPPARAPGSEDYTDEMLAYARTRSRGELDLVFLVDETGSMGPYIDEVKHRLLALIAAVRAAPLCRSLRIGLVSYRDHPPEDLTFVSRVAPLTDDVPTLQKTVARMRASGGGDGPEAVTDGLYDLVRLDFRPRAARVVVWVGDAPPHGVEPHGDGFPDGCPCGHHWYAQAESCREMGIVVHAVGCLPALRRYTSGVEVFRTVAGITRGLYLPLSEARLLVPLITGVAESELDKQRIEEHVADAVARHEAALAVADERERVRFVRDVLEQEGVRPRGMAVDEGGGRAAQRFRGITEADVEEGLERLRRAGRMQI